MKHPVPRGKSTLCSTNTAVDNIVVEISNKYIRNICLTAIIFMTIKVVVVVVVIVVVHVVVVVVIVVGEGEKKEEKEEEEKKEEEEEEHI